jgi:hypothetical protein
MNHTRFLILATLFSLMAAQGYAQAPAKGYDVFATVKTRNIFDPTRRPVRNETPQDSKARDRTRPSYFTLTGTMVVDGRSLAFFSGSRSEYSKVIPVGESVAGYKVLAITPLQAEVEREGKSFVMAVGHRLQLEGLTDEIPASELTGANGNNGNNNNSPSSPSAPGAPSSAPPAVSTDKAELLRRMMERAQAERR